MKTDLVKWKVIRTYLKEYCHGTLFILNTTCINVFLHNIFDTFNVFTGTHSMYMQYFANFNYIKNDVLQNEIFLPFLLVFSLSMVEKSPWKSLAVST